MNKGPRVICPKCTRLTEPIPEKQEAVFMYNTVMLEMASIFCRQCGEDLTLMVREYWSTHL